jgi:hypothetical protein
MKPILLIDIDGVLCPFDTNDERLEPIIGHEWAVMDPRHTPWLKELEDLYRFAWCSYWERGGNDVIGPAHDLDPIPFIVFNIVNPYDQTYKLHEVKEFIGDEPVAWIDDGFFEDAFKWAGERNKSVPTRLIHTDPTVGLDEAAMQDLRQFGYTFQNS